MNKLARLFPSLQRAAAGSGLAAPPQAAWNFAQALGLATAAKGETSVSKEELEDFLEHSTGPEREELEAKAQGIENPWHEAWLDAPFGTEDNPVVVPSEFSERIVGVNDPDDDSLVWWGMIEDGQPPKQIIEGGEFFVLKRVPSSGGHH